jgi:hypothetical protein
MGDHHLNAPKTNDIRADFRPVFNTAVNDSFQDENAPPRVNAPAVNTTLQRDAVPILSTFSPNVAVTVAPMCSISSNNITASTARAGFDNTASFTTAASTENDPSQAPTNISTKTAYSKNRKKITENWIPWDNFKNFTLDQIEPTKKRKRKGCKYENTGVVRTKAWEQWGLAATCYTVTPEMNWRSTTSALEISSRFLAAWNAKIADRR